MRVEDDFCDSECPEDYFNATPRYCGGEDLYFSFYQEYDLDFNGQGAFDPWRRIWYQSTAIRAPLDTAGPQGMMSRGAPVLEWFLHASNTTTGDPLFPFQARLDYMLNGMHYDLDNSRLVGHSVPYWSGKGVLERWVPELLIFKMNSSSLSDITMTRSNISFELTSGTTAENFLMASTITALDSVNNVYYLTVPDVPAEPDNPAVSANFTSRIYGINMNEDQSNRIILNKTIPEHRLLSIQANSRWDDSGLYAMTLEDGMVPSPADNFTYLELGTSSKNFSGENVTFDWTYASVANSSVNPITGYASEYTYQMGSGIIDYYAESVFVVGKEQPDVSVEMSVADFRHNTSLSDFAFDFSILSMPGMQTMQLMNLDPVVPWLPPPKVLWARFAMDGFSVTVQFEEWTYAGIEGVDTDGDTLPEYVDWSGLQVGNRSCLDMFDGNVSMDYLGWEPWLPVRPEDGGYLPNTTCVWNFSNAQVTVFMPSVITLRLGDVLAYRNETITRFVPMRNQFSYPLYGSIDVDYPDPITPPIIAVRHNAQNANSRLAPIIHMRVTGPDSLPPRAKGPVKLCEHAWFNASESWDHGGLPRWQWTLVDMHCESIGGYVFDPDPTLRASVMSKLENSTRGLEWLQRGSDVVQFPLEILEPGCTYFLELNVTSRWEANTTVTWMMEKLNPTGALSWVPDCDWFCNVATCEPPSKCGADGICICAPGIFGLFCSGLCPPCSPLGTARCDDGRLGSGACVCRAGFYGPLCRQRTEWRASEWSECEGQCNSAVGFRTRLYTCNNVETGEEVDPAFCYGQPDLLTQPCVPEECPCGPPPTITGANNLAIAEECQETLSGESCMPICLDGYIAMGMFRCVAGSFVEVPLCEKAGKEINAVVGLTLSVRLGAIPAIAAQNPTAYLETSFLGLGLRRAMTAQMLAQDVMVVPTDFDISVRSVINEEPGGGTAGRRLQSTITLDLLVAVGIRNPTDLERIESVLMDTASSPGGLFERLKAELRRNFPDAPIPGSLGLTPPARTQIYFQAEEIANRTTTPGPTLVPPLPPREPVVTEDNSAFVAGLGLGFGIAGAFAAMLLVGGSVWWFRRRTKFASSKVVSVDRKSRHSRAPSLQVGGPSRTSSRLAWSPQGARLDSSPGNTAVANLGDASPASPHSLDPVVSLALPPVPPEPHEMNPGAVVPVRPSPPDPANHVEVTSDFEDAGAEANLPTGFVKQAWKGGGTYEGQLVRGKREGEGIMFWPTGKIYVGQWRDDRFHGHGLLFATAERGCTYNGDWVQGQCHGVGRVEWPSRGTWYDGEWVDGLQDGMGEVGSFRRGGRQGGSQLPQVTAHICRMEKGHRQENLTTSPIGAVGRDSTSLTTVRLHASDRDLAMCRGSVSGGTLGEVQTLAPLWGVAFGRTDDWIPGRLGAIVLTRILDGGALARWSSESGHQAIRSNALIWSVNGIVGDPDRMGQELCAAGRRHVTLELQNPPCTKFPELRERMQRRRGGGKSAQQSQNWKPPWLGDPPPPALGGIGGAMANIPPPPPPKKPKNGVFEPPAPPPPRMGAMPELPRLPPAQGAAPAQLAAHSWVSVPRRSVVPPPPPPPLRSAAMASSSGAPPPPAPPAPSRGPRRAPSRPPGGAQPF